MNDFSEIEKELKKLRPVRPSQRLLSAVEKAIEGLPEAHPATPVVFRKFTIPFPRLSFGWGLGLAAAAAAVILIVVRVSLPTGPLSEKQIAATTKQTAPLPVIPSAQFIPSGATRVVYHTQDEGLVFPDGATQPVRRVRSHTRESLQWRNPKTGASLEVSYPTEQVHLVPAPGQ